MGKVQLVVSVLLVSALLPVLLVVACAPAVAPAPQASAPAPQVPAPAAAVPLAPAKAAWEVEWEKTVKGAQQEGTVVFFSVIGGAERQDLTKAFTSKYGVRIEWVGGATDLLLQKLAAEQRAGIYSVDAWVSTATKYPELKGYVDRLEPLLVLPDLTEPEVVKKTWYLGELDWVDTGRTAMVATGMDVKQDVALNTNLVKPGEIKTYQDLLNPKWKGKIGLRDPRVSGGGQSWFATVLQVGDVDANYMRKLLTEQELYLTADGRLLVEWLAHGKLAVSIAATTLVVTQFIQVGAPVDRTRLGTPYMDSPSSAIAVPKRAPHPNAAKLLVNWFLSQEGQTFLSRAIGVQSQRFDVPTDHLDPSRVHGPGLRLFSTYREEVLAKRADYYVPLAKEIFTPKK